MKLNNKGYLLVEIILASAIAFGLAFFIIDLVLKLKNKNDDLMVETLINTDKTIITNKLMSYAKDDPESFDCRKLTKEGNTIKYNGNIIDNVNKYTKIKELKCTNDMGKITIEVPLEVPQQPDKDYDINLDYKYQIGDMTPPTCSLTLGTNGLITATYQDNDGGSGVAYYGFSSSYTGDSSNSKNISSVGNYTYYVKDRAGNTANCSLNIIKPNATYTCKKNYDKCQDGYTWNGSSCYSRWCDKGGYTWSCTGASYGEGRNYSSCNGDTFWVNDPSRCSAKSWTCCYYASASKPLSQCTSGTNRNGACYLDNQTSCSSGFSVDSTNYSCSSGYTKTTDNLYCYK